MFYIIKLFTYKIRKTGTQNSNFNRFDGDMRGF